MKRLMTCIQAIGKRVLGCSADLPRRVVEQYLALSSVHFSEHIARLLIVIVVDTVVPVSRCAVDRQRRLVLPRVVFALAATMSRW